MNNQRVYISGPISGLPREQYMELFRIAEKMLRRRGYRVCNPTRVWACRWPWLYKVVGYRLTLLYDLWLLMQCDLIYKLPGWRDSKGANIESCTAYHMKVWPLPQPDVKKLDKRLTKLMEKWKRERVNPCEESQGV